MSRAIRVLGGALLCAGGLTGCGTPQPILDQANNGAALISEVSTDVTDFKNRTASINQGRIDRANAALQSVQARTAEHAKQARVESALGIIDKAKWISQIQALADAIADSTVAQQTQNEQETAAAAKLLTALPDQSKQLANTKTALAALGVDLSNKDQLSALGSFVKQFRDEEQNSKNCAIAAANKVMNQQTPATSGAATPEATKCLANATTNKPAVTVVPGVTSPAPTAAN